MRNQKTVIEESTTAFAIAALLLNALIVLILCTGAWFAHQLFSNSDLLGAMLREGTWR